MSVMRLRPANGARIMVAVSDEAVFVPFCEPILGFIVLPFALILYRSRVAFLGFNLIYTLSLGFVRLHNNRRTVNLLKRNIKIHKAFCMKILSLVTTLLEI